VLFKAALLLKGKFVITINFHLVRLLYLFNGLGILAYHPCVLSPTRQTVDLATLINWSHGVWSLILLCLSSGTSFGLVSILRIVFMSNLLYWWLLHAFFGLLVSQWFLARIKVKRFLTNVVAEGFAADSGYFDWGLRRIVWTPRLTKSIHTLLLRCLIHQWWFPLYWGAHWGYLHPGGGWRHTGWLFRVNLNWETDGVRLVLQVSCWLLLRTSFLKRYWILIRLDLGFLRWDYLLSGISSWEHLTCATVVVHRWLTPKVLR
jgi:hypothetical protein